MIFIDQGVDEDTFNRSMYMQNLLIMSSYVYKLVRRQLLNIYMYAVYMI